MHIGFVFSVLVWNEIIREGLEAILRQSLIHTRLGKVSLLDEERWGSDWQFSTDSFGIAAG